MWFFTRLNTISPWFYNIQSTLSWTVRPVNKTNTKQTNKKCLTVNLCSGSQDQDRQGNDVHLKLHYCESQHTVHTLSSSQKKRESRHIIAPQFDKKRQCLCFLWYERYETSWTELRMKGKRRAHFWEMTRVFTPTGARFTGNAACRALMFLGFGIIKLFENQSNYSIYENLKWSFSRVLKWKVWDVIDYSARGFNRLMWDHISLFR